jgi:2-polyprenyl-3-methyl-5-hydroxy-6-metoxy-1,4-benzoquinol methylase
MKTNFESAKKFVEMKRRHNHESLSGPGSHLSNAKEVISLVNNTVKKYNIQSILDLGCGDFNWLKEVDLKNVKYMGWDACPKMIENNNKKYGNNDVKFFTKDIVLEHYPNVDLIICRDVLFHMKKSISKKIINNVKNKCKYFISTSFKKVNKNSGIGESLDWDFYLINLDIEPFNLKPYEIDHELETKNYWQSALAVEPRFVCLYRL